MLYFLLQLNNSSVGIIYIIHNIILWLLVLDLKIPADTRVYHNRVTDMSTHCLEEQGTHAAHLRLLLYEYLEILVDDGDSQQNTSPRPEIWAQIIKLFLR